LSPRGRGGVEVPTLVTWGLQDPYQLHGLLEGLDAYVADLRLVRIEDAGHYSMRTRSANLDQRRRLQWGSSASRELACRLLR
jgi:pimeloyl-ACP methyl ester carboxylesterase